ncbi:MAG: sugar ABC transporter substrate-binding protein, partial [Mesorhizobium sp.]
MKKFVAALAALAICATALITPALAQDKKFTVALIPGLTTDGFYIT